MRVSRRITGVALVAAVLAPASAMAQAQDLTDWLNAHIDSIVAGRILQRDPGKMPQFPSASATRASLIDRANLPDIAGISIALPNQSSVTGQVLPTAATLSASPYMLWALLNRENPLDPTTYLRSAITRRIGFSTSWEQDPATGSSIPLVQGKVLILDRGNPLKTSAGPSALKSGLAAAAADFGMLQHAVAMVLWRRVGRPAGRDSIAYERSLADPAVFEAARKSAGAAGMKEIDDAIVDRIESFVGLRKDIDTMVNESRRRPQFSLGFTQRGVMSNFQEARYAAIFDVARDIVDFTINGSYTTKRLPTAGWRGDGELAGQLIFALDDDPSLNAGQPLTLTLAGSASRQFQGGSAHVFKLQAMMLLPVGDGVNVPLSATWASSNDLIQEKKIVGNVGFSFDVAQMFAAKR